MALQKQNLNLPFTGGVDTKTDPKQVGPGKLTLLQNAYFYNPKEIRKRPGGQALNALYIDSANGTAGSISAQYGLWTRGAEQELLTADGQYLYSYSNERGWTRKSPFATNNSPTGTGYIPATLTINQIQRETDSLTAPCSAVIAGSYRAAVWEAAGGTYARSTIVDTTTGTNVAYDVPVGDQTVTHPTCPKVFPLGVGLFLYIIWEKIGAGAGSLKFYYVDTTAVGALVPQGALASPITAIATVSNKPIYDAATAADGSVNVVYRDSADKISVVNIATDTSGGAPVLLIATVETPICISTWYSASQSQNYVAWFDATPHGRYFVYNASFTVLVRAKTIFSDSTGTNLAGVASPSANSSTIFFNVNQSVCRADVNSAGTVNDMGRVCANTQMASKPAATNSNRAIIWVKYTQSYLNSQPTYFLMSESAFTSTAQNLVIAQAAMGSAGDHPLVSRGFPEMTFDGTTYEAALLQSDRTTVTGGNVLFQQGVMTAGITLNTAATSAELANTLHLTGGILWSYDGASMVEQNFLLFPDFSALPSNTAGTGLGAGTYSYLGVFEWMDAQGQVHQSTPSIPKNVVVVGGATGQVTMTFCNLWVTNKVSPSIAKVNLAIYRTEANSAGPYYRASSYNPITSDTAFTVTATVATFIDDVPDSTLIGNQQLYTSGGEVPNASPPASLALATYKNRVISLNNGGLNWSYSKEIIDGVPVEFSPNFTQQIDERGGAAVGIGVLDDKLVFFKKKGIFVVVGDGPAPSGVGDDYTPGTFVTTDTGAVSAASIVSMPDGLMFQSEKGIEILTRRMMSSYIGADVQSYVNGNRVISATLVSSVTQVRFLMSSGVTLVYDYFVKDETGVGQWSVYTNQTGVGAVLWQNRYTRAVGNGTTLYDSGTDDNGSFIAIGATTSWLSLAGIQGFQRVYKAMILGEWKSAHNLVVGISYDFDDTIVQTETISAATSSVPYQWRILLNRQKCESIKFTINDAHTTTNGESLRISGIALEVGAKQGLQKSPQTKTYG